LRSSANADRVRQRWRQALVIVEITLTVALLVQAATLIDGFQRSRTATLGYDTRPLATFRVHDAGGVPTARLLEAVGSLPGVSAVGASSTVVYATIGPQVRVATSDAGGATIAAEGSRASPGFFDSLGVRLLAGRTFTPNENESTRTAIVTESLARRLLLGRTATGMRIWIDAVPYEVVGVVADYSTNPLSAGPPEPKVFLPLPEIARPRSRLNLLVRAEGDPAPLIELVRKELRDMLPGVVLAESFTVDQIREIMSQEVLLGSAPLLPLILIGILLTTAGIYGVLAFAISRRSRELAVRLALGATPGDLTRLVAVQALRLVFAGATLGAAATFVVGRLIRASGGAGSVFDTAAHVYLAPLAILIVVGAVATWLPARRLRRLDAAVLLRTS
jgi:ABC-type antimicrobial peptide transport system permease subunit